MIMFIFTTLIGCNPKPDYCIEGSVKGVYLCTKEWTTLFDTRISLKLYVDSKDRYKVADVYEDVYDLLLKYHRYFDKYNPYEGVVNVYTINQNSSETVVIDEALFDAIEYVLQEEQTVKIGNDNLFNIALNPILKIWHDARENAACTTDALTAQSVCPVPSSEQLNSSFNINPNDILLNRNNLTIAFAKPNMSIDLGGFGKGYAAEVVTDYLDQLNIKYILNAGNSNVKAGGINPNNSDGYYYIALIEPNLNAYASTTYFIYLKVSGGEAIVTSGNYQRFFIGQQDQKIYHHIIDPRTHYPGGEVMSVTVISENGAMADIYSTAIYLMTLAEGKTFVEATLGLEAIWYKEDGTVEYSSGFNQYIYQLFPNR